MRTTAGCVGLVALSFFPTLSHAQQGFLENPQPSSAQSGIGVVSGWHCQASSIDLQIDGGRLIQVPYGSERKDTESVCGDWDNGFSFLLNYSGMGDGSHIVTVYADGAPFAQSSFQVTTLGQEFLSGVQKTVTVSDFPSAGDTAVLRWDQAKQNFALDSVQFGQGVGGNFDGVYYGTATPVSFVTGQGTPCGSAQIELVVNGQQLSGQASDSWGRLYSITGTVDSAGNVSFALALAQGNVANVTGSLSSGSANGSWEDVYGCRGSWSAQR